MLRSVAALSIVLGGLLACGSAFSPPAGLPFSTASNACWGMGPASAIELAPEPISPGELPAFPYVRVTISGTPRSLNPGTITLPSDNGVAYYITGPDHYEAGVGRISLRRVSDETVAGYVDIQFDSERIQGEFRAEWHARFVTCV